MKHLMMITAAAVVMTLSGTAWAGPAVGSTSFRGGGFAMNRAPERPERPAYALRGEAETVEYRWETQRIRVGSNRGWRTIPVRVPVEIDPR